MSSKYVDINPEKPLKVMLADNVTKYIKLDKQNPDQNPRKVTRFWRCISQKLEDFLELCVKS